MVVWVADNKVFELVQKIKNKYHNTRLNDANIAVSFVDSKAFIKDKFNFGKTTKFSPSAKVWHNHQGGHQFDFLISLSSEAWSILSDEQKEALIDLRLACMQVEYEPEVIEENGKKNPVKDEWGRQVYTDVPKTDEEGNPKWKVALDLHVIMDNIGRYGCWCQDLVDLKSVIKDSESSKSEVNHE